MINPQKLESLAKQLHESMPEGIKQFANNTQEKGLGLLEQQLQKLDLVSREEFELQKQVLQKTRAKVEALEQELAALKAKLERD
ncbi:accessory factor UbiK family protein [Paraferrimonas sp. SM1919]|uniref:accessory factor UbiK family protein n=1 Tax=Paraferrimonas sp. SM1919 TaxID=2662263 RepID=UPI0013D44083|nr:accessory factor UbiK family protein [Paraferrimonas sp. SM1919]